MKLFGKRQWTISLIGLVGGLILSAMILKVKYGEINYIIVGLTGIIGMSILLIIRNIANRESK